MPQDKLIIRGARVNNLKDITVEIPKNKLVVITGLSGSGKSSLAFDTIFAEGQRRYVESLSSYARQFLELQDKPDVDEIKGLSPTIAIDQRGISENPRSTVGTITEIADYLRLLFARAGKVKCLNCDIELSRASTEDIVRLLKQEISKNTIRILAPIIRCQALGRPVPGNGDSNDLLERLTRAGFEQVRLNGEIVLVRALQASGLPDVDFKLDAVLGVYGPKELESESEHIRMQILTALELGDGTIAAEIAHNTKCSAEHSVFNSRHSDPALAGEESREKKKGIHSSPSAPQDDASRQFFFSKDLTCPKCARVISPLEPRDFSFNSPHGACPACNGLGVKLTALPELVIPNPRLSLAQGAIKPWSRIGANQSARLELLNVVAKVHKFDINAPVSELSKRARDIVLYGTGNELYEVEGLKMKFSGVIPELESRHGKTDSDYLRKEIETYMHRQTCKECDGARLKPSALAVSFANKNIAGIGAMSIEQSISFFENLPTFNEAVQSVVSPITKEILRRLKDLKRAGIGYLTLDRASNMLSGGEGQRVRLAIQLATTLSGVIYILDEPTIGLHERDTVLLLDLLKKLLAQDNTVLVVEHDSRVMREADWIIDMGPGAGVQGGEIVASGAPAAIARNTKSLTGAYLSGAKQISLLKKTRRGNGKALTIKGAAAFNLKNIDVKIPLGKFVCVTGVSGSGKSTLILEILAKALARKLYNAHDLPAEHKEIIGMKNIDKVITVDQTPIGRTPRSNPATYTGIFSIIRDLYTEVPEAKLKGFDAGTFSFNVKGGRCESCAGEGYIKIPMQFMSETFVVCSECRGARYRPEALEIHYKNKNIADILKMSASEAKEFFSAKGGSASGGKNTNLICEKLQVLEDVGLGYIRLGQPAPTLSGGEAQRVKLSTELSRRATGKTLYILDEPTTGLHFQDIQHLLGVLDRLVEKGNSVIVIEHNMDVIKSADWVIDLGPDGGDKGGELVAEGEPKDICKVKRSYTGQYLKRIM